MNQKVVNTVAATLASLVLTGCLNIYIPKTSYYDNFNQKIVFVEDKKNKYGASAKYVERIPTIHYDPWWMGQFPKEFQSFIFHHEIGHFQLGHLLVGNSFIYKGTLDPIEHEADCYSMRYLEERLNYTPEQIGRVYRIATNFFGERRAERMRRCVVNNWR